MAKKKEEEEEEDEKIGRCVLHFFK
jgi:hypothetical protein